MPRQPEKPDGATEVTTYEGFRWYAQGWMKGTIGNLIVVGHTSQGKTETIKGVAGQGSLTLQGLNSPTSAFMRIQDWVVQQGNTGPIIIDDADPLFTTLAGQTFMKELVLDKPNRTVTHNTEYARLSQVNLSQAFQMSNPVAIILNKWRTFNEHLAAVKARGKLLYVNFSAAQVHNYVGTWFLKRPAYEDQLRADDVYSFVGRFLPLMPVPNIREYYEEPLKDLLTELVVGPNPEGNWRRMILKKLVKPNEIEAALLFSGDNFMSHAQMAKAYEKAGYGSARTFYRHLANFKGITETSYKQAIATMDEEETRLKTAIRQATPEEILEHFLNKTPPAEKP